MKKFRTWHTQIEEVEVQNETSHYVVIMSGKLEAKRSDRGNNYFDTWQGAKDFLIKREKFAIMDLKRQIAKHEEMLREIEAMVG